MTAIVFVIAIIAVIIPFKIIIVIISNFMFMGDTDIDDLLFLSLSLL